MSEVFKFVGLLATIVIVVFAIDFIGTLICDELDKQYMEGQRAQRDLDMLALHNTFGFGAKRLNKFNDTANEIVDYTNQWIKDDKRSGGQIARDIIKKELEKIKGVVIGD